MADPPLLLLPVRLETRFQQGGSGYQLMLRVYPDVVHSDSHEPDLTPDEAAWGAYFWSQPATAQLAAWGTLVSRYGRPRAAWIARVTDSSDPARPVVGTTQSASWTRAPRTSVLPDHWIALGYDASGNQLFSQAGSQIPVGQDGVQLETGPSPTAPASVPAGMPAVSQGMRWMIDFQAAVSAGMAMTIELTYAQQHQLDRIVVLGWRATDATSAVSSLLQAHHYTDGLGLVPQGTPTNNTADAPAGYASRSRDDAASLALEIQAPATLDPASDGHLLAAALGLDDSVLARTANATGRQQQQAGAMNTALWSATLGYFLTQMMAGSFNYNDTLIDDQVRQHFSQLVRARGPLPVLRVGNQPYGVLPVMSMALWTPTQTSDVAIVDVINKALGVWEGSADQVPKIGAAPGGPPGDSTAQTLLSILGTEAVSVSYAARPVLGGGYFDYLWQFMSGAPLINDPLMGATWWNDQATAAATSLAALGAATNPFLARAVFAGRQFALDAPLVYGGSVPDGAPLPATANYLTWLQGAGGYQAINAQVGYDQAGQPAPLLYLLLRHSALREYATAAYRYATPSVPFLARLDPELVGVAPGAQATVWSQIQAGGDLSGHPNVAGFLASLGQLAQAPVRDLELLLAETLDLCTHRLDAWVSSFATKRLGQLRAATPQGLYVGGYGWVDNLSAVTPGTPGAPSAGYVHAPSLAHATTAAVLRSGYLSHRDSSGAFALDLSSAQVRTARQLLDGVRQGQPLGALLGYRFERGLHEHNLDQYIDAFRRLAPLGDVAQAQAQAQNAAASAASLASQATTVHAQIDPAQQQADSLAAQIPGAQSKLQADRATLAASQAQAAHLNDEIAGLDRQIVRTNDPDGSLARAETELEAELNPLEDQISAQQAVVATDQAQLATLTAQQQAAANQADSLRAQWNSLVAQGQAATAEQAAATARYQALLASTAAQYQLSQAAELSAIQPAVESVAAANVVDGLALYRQQRAGAIPWGTSGLPVPSSADYTCLVKQLGDLVTAVRALSDALLAESVYQTVQGNPVRGAAALDALGRGEVAPPELEVTSTPRTGTGITQRLLVLFTGTPPAPAGWATAPRGQAEPVLNAWAGLLLGDPSRVTCQASFLDPAGGSGPSGSGPSGSGVSLSGAVSPQASTASGNVAGSATITLAELGLCPLDLVYAADRGLESGAELTQRLIQAALASAQAPAGATADQVSLTCTRQQADAAHVSVAEAVEAARSIRQVIASRPAEASDLTTPGDARVAVSADLSGRAGAAMTALQACAAALQAAITTFQAATTAADQATAAAELNAALLGAAALGVPDCVLAADQASPDGQAALAALAGAALTQVQDRQAQASAASTSLDQIQAIFGGTAFTVLTGFTPANASDLGQAFGESTAVQGGDPLAATTWVQRMSRVRGAVDRLWQALTYAEAISLTPGSRFEVGQLPYLPGDRWGGLAGPLAGGRLALIAHAPFALTLDGSQPLAGLMVDEVTEVVPNPAERTAVAFPYADPGARAPQALLLAVPPDDNPWSQATLEATVLEAINLAERVRPVDPDALRQAGQLLPALYFAVNVAGDTVSTDFTAAGSQSTSSQGGA